MEFLVKYILVFVLALVAALLLVPVTKRLAPRLGLVDIPSDRRIHKTPIPRCGGIAVFFATHLALLVVFMGPWKNLGGSVQIEEWWKILVGSGLLFVLGLVDDRYEMRACFKLLGQLAVAAIMFAFGFSFESLLGYPLPFVLNFGATLFWFTLLINAFNLVDGMDGACAGLGIVSSCALVVLLIFLRQLTDALVLLALVGACLGFLRYNFHPASVFLGDCGSMFIGFMLAAISMKANVSQSLVVSLLVPLLAVGVPIFDVMMAVWRRLARKVVSVLKKDAVGCNVFGPDLDHIHHKLLKSGLTQRKAAISLYAGAALLCVMSLCSVMMTSRRTAVLLLGTVIVVHVVIRQLAHVELWTSAQILLQGLRRPQAVLRLFLHIAWDLCVLAGATFFVYRLLFPTPLPLSVVSVCVWIPFVVMYLFGIYRTIWARSRPAQYLKLGLELFSGEVFSFAVLLWFTPLGVRELLFPHVIHFETVLIGIVGFRMLPRLLRDTASWLRRYQATGNEYRTLLLGAGNDTALYLKMVSHFDVSLVSRRIVGVVDNTEAIQGKYVFGYPVLGRFQDLDALVEEYLADEVIVCRKVNEAERVKLLGLRSQQKVKLKSFRSFLHEVDDSGFRKEALETIPFDQDAEALVEPVRVMNLTDCWDGSHI